MRPTLRALANVTGAACVSAVAASASAEMAPTPQPRLLMVQVLFRHGARTPVYTNVPGLAEVAWPPCSHGNAEPFSLAVAPGVDGAPPSAVRLHHLADSSRPAPAPPADIMSQWRTRLGGGCRGGQLTDLGASQALALGARLRARYADRLPGLGARWDCATMSARSTCVPRCVASAQFVLAGLFPPPARAERGRPADARAAAEPVPLAIGDFDTETLFPNGRLSERLRALLAQGRAAWERSPPGAALALRAELDALVPADAFAAYGFAAHNYVRARDVLVALRAHGLPLPYGLDAGALVERVDALATEQIVTMMRAGGAAAGGASEAEVHRHSLGIVMAELLAQMAARARGESAHCLRLYSAHDTTVLPLLMVLGAFEPKHRSWPDFASSVALELYDLRPAEAGPRTEARVGVRVVYASGGREEDITARVPGCPRAGPCPLEAFREAVRHNLPGADGDVGADPHGGARDPVLVGSGMSGRCDPSTR
jgi:hypothetical protein